MNNFLKIMVLTMCVIPNYVRGGEKMLYVYNVSIIQLIATPEKYDGKLIRVSGFSTVPSLNRKSRGMLYLSMDDYKYSITQNAIGLSLDNSEKHKYKKNSLQYSTIEGKFNAKQQTSSLCSNGVIESITRFDEKYMPNLEGKK